MLILILFALHSAAADLPSYYHLLDEVSLSSYSCASVTTVLDNPKIQLLTLNPDAQRKAFLMFGEHARELIGPETGLHLLQAICDGKYDLSKYQIKMILNLNPISRARVEQGDYCLRLNENGVDLNRNYDAHF